MVDGAFEDAVVIRAAAGDDVILRRFGRPRLEKFLQLTLWIFENRYDIQPAKRSAKLAEDEIARRLITAIEEYRTHESFKRVGERGRTLAAAVQFFAATQNQVLPQPQFA